MKCAIVYEINLDLEPSDRFNELIKNFDIRIISKTINNIYDKFTSSLSIIMNNIIKSIISKNIGKVMYFDEINYWSELFQIPFHKVLVLQLIYELNSACSTFVTNINENQTMIRTMDWAMSELKEMTYIGQFYKNDKLIYSGVCWLGSVGMFTVKSHEHNYSVAINYRKTMDMSLISVLENYNKTINMFWPVSYLLRYLIEQNLSYELVIKNLNESPLISPTYYIVNKFDAKPVIIQRNSQSYDLIIGNEGNVIQTNCDNDKFEPDILYSCDRREMIDKIIKNYNNYDDIIERVYNFPVINEETIYFCIINKNIFEVWLI